MSPDRLRLLKSFEEASGARFKDMDHLNLAFAHRSYTNEAQDSRQNNERLEFLGDSVLGLVVSSHLYGRLPNRPEGELAKIKSFVVSEQILSVIARDLYIDKLLLIGKGEENSGGREKRALLADALEAVFGAYYLDAGFFSAEQFILGLLGPQIQLVLEDKHQKDYKTLLQEYVQKEHKSYPKYNLLEKSGPDHDRTFVIEVQVLGKIWGSGIGRTKKEAEQASAQVAYTAMVRGSSED
jgi:ribonuclease-3